MRWKYTLTYLKCLGEESSEVFRGTKGPSLSKEEWERISASIYGFATTELNLKRPQK